MEATATARSRSIFQLPALRMIGANTDVVLAIGVILILALMIIPVPPALLDVLLATNIAVAILILMVSMYLTNPLELSVFPGLLLILTIFRLGLNVAATRLILGDGYAGEVISAFGSFVVRNPLSVYHLPDSGVDPVYRDRQGAGIAEWRHGLPLMAPETDGNRRI
jgi:flagellar biosynthesis component FlhA